MYEDPRFCRVSYPACPQRYPDQHVEQDDRLDLDQADDQDDRADYETDDILFTCGVQSTVINKRESEVGHVLLVDADDAEALDVLALAEQTDGISAVLESSLGSFHLWNLSVREHDQQVLRQLDLRIADDSHAGSSRRRGYSVLRFGAKRHDSGETYKERPTLRAVYCGDDGGHHQSRPHAEALRSIAREQGHTSAVSRLTEALDGQRYIWTGDAETLLTDQYATITDECKADLRGD